MDNEIKYAANEMKTVLKFKDVTEHFGIDYNHAGFARCPFHNERTPSFKGSGSYGKCFGCGWSGDIFDFVMAYEGTTFQDAVKRVADSFGFKYNFDHETKLSAKELEMRKSMKKLLAEKAEREAKVKALEEKRHQLFEAWVTIDKLLDDLSGEDRAEASANMDKLSYEIDCVDAQLWELHNAEKSTFNYINNVRR